MHTENKATTQEVIKYAYSQMLKRLPDKSTEDNFLHDLQFKGLSREEAEQAREREFEKGNLAYDPDGWLKWVK